MKNCVTVLSLLLCTVSIHLYAQSLEVTFYGQRHSLSNQKSGTTKNGATGGMYFYFAGDFGDWAESEIHPGDFALGWAMDSYVGFGTLNSSFAFDLSADIFGLTGRYKLNNSDLCGFFYDPIQLYGTPLGSYFGSKLNLKYIHDRFQLNFERGGGGMFTGFIAPNELQQTMHAVSLQYRFGSSVWFGGIRYSTLSNNSSDRGNAFMVYVGFGE